jgi:hypothetical protein
VTFACSFTSSSSTNLKATLAKRATVGPQKETAMMTPAALNAGDRIFLCWIKTTRLRESKPSLTVEMKEF